MRMSFSAFALLAATAALTLFPRTGLGQGELIQRLERQQRQLDELYRLQVPTDQPLAERTLLDYGGSARFGFYAIDDEFSSTRILRQTDASLYLLTDYAGAHRFYGELRFTYNDFNTGDGSGTGQYSGDGLEYPLGDQFWYFFDLRGATLAQTGQQIDHNLTFKIGRQFVQWGSGLSLSNDLYAGLIDLECNNWGLTGLAGYTPSSSTIDFDSTRANFDSETDRAFFGARLEYRGHARHRPYVSFLSQRDHNNDTLFAARLDYDSYYTALGSTGTLAPHWLYRTELVWESGRGMSDAFGFPQTREQIEAFAGVLTLIYLPGDESNSRFEFEVAGGSGDSDRTFSSTTAGGNLSGTKDNAFNGLGYLNTGLVLSPEISNLLVARLGWSTDVQVRRGASARALRFGVNGYLFHKIDENAPISSQTVSNSFVGGEIDVFADWRLYSDLSLHIAYGLFLPGDAMPSGQDDPRNFLYLGVSYAF